VFFELDENLFIAFGDLLAAVRRAFPIMVAHCGLMPDQFGGGHDQRKVVVDIVTQSGKFVIQILNLVQRSSGPAGWRIRIK